MLGEGRGLRLGARASGVRALSTLGQRGRALLVPHLVSCMGIAAPGATRLGWPHGHNSWIAKVKRIEFFQRGETSRELIADAVALVDKWNADLERCKEANTATPTAHACPSFHRTSARPSSQGNRGCGCNARPAASKARLICVGWCARHPFPSTASMTR